MNLSEQPTLRDMIGPTLDHGPGLIINQGIVAVIPLREIVGPELAFACTLHWMLSRGPLVVV